MALFTAVEYLVTSETRVEPGPCGPPPLIRPAITRGCDDDGFYMVQVAHSHMVITPLDNGMCHILTIFVVEQYHSMEVCRDYTPPDLPPPVEWAGLLDPAPVSWDWPPPDNPTQWIESAIDLGNGQLVCENDVRVQLTMACVHGRIQVSRRVSLILSTPLPGGRCRKLAVTGPAETYLTQEPCEVLDWVDAPAGFTAGLDPELLWKRAAEHNAAAAEKAEEGTFRLGTEWSRGTPLQRAVRQLHRLESQSGIPLDQTRARHVVIRRLDGAPCTPKALASVPGDRAVIALVGIEGSDFQTKLPLHFLTGVYV